MRSSLWVALAAVLATVRSADAQCTFHTDYYAPKSPGVCVADPSVPVGCPIHVIAPSGSRPETYAPTVGLDPVTAVAKTLGVLALPGSEVDVNSCDCATRSFVASFDQLELTIAGLHDGDTVSFQADEAADESQVRITAAGACPPPAWPSSVHVAARCDRCPTMDPTDPPAPPHDEPAAAGCSGSPGGSWIVGLVVLGLVARRRTRRR
jgi:MYXO-CTERM domain-containing protein